MENKVIVTTQTELQTLIQDAVNVAVQQFSLPQKIDPLPLPDYLNMEQASKFLNLAKPTLYAHTSRREIPHIKKGKHLYFIKSELDRWLLEGRMKTREELIISKELIKRNGK